MATQSPVPNQSVEEILASIRQAIADDESRRGRALKPVPPSPQPAGRQPGPTAGRTLASANDDDWEMETDLATQNVIDLAIERAIDGVSAAVNDAARSVQSGRERPLPERRQIEDHQSEPRPALGASRPPLISARAGAAVAASFEDLARNVASLTQAQIREMAQEMLRPMLKAWLDDNLPGVVERLVRDEIERVSRGR